MVSLCSLEQEGAPGLVLVNPSEFNDLNQERKKLGRSASITPSFILPGLWSFVIVFMCYSEWTQ